MDSREDFEAWVERVADEPTSPTHANGDYSNLEDQAAWRAWQHQQARIDHHKELISIKEGVIDELEAERDQLREQNAALEANVERLRHTLDKIFYQPVPGEISEELQEVYDMAGIALSLTDEQCLARIRAEAKAEAMDHARLLCSGKADLGAMRRIIEARDEYRKAAQEPESTP